MIELPKDRLATTDEKGKRIYLYPLEVYGFFKKRKSLVHTILLFVFLILPWIYVHGRQWFFLNLAKREFFLFGLEFRAHDTPLILLVLLTFTFTIGLLTAIFGRIWCGWACPQTVFVEALFRRIETLVEGNARERQTRDQAPWTADTYFRKSIKVVLFLIVSLIITHSFLAYFVGSRELLAMIQSSPIENWSSFLVILATTTIIFLDFGWFREQFCIIVCPYGRFQSVLLDSHSMIVAYDEKRGEPRRTVPPNTNSPQGDCVNCFLCVKACPTGIDIRRGLQMECIACTACIDACDGVMDKIKKPQGLIRYTSQAELQGRPRKNLRARTLVYSGLLLAAVLPLVFLLRTKEFMEIAVLRAKEAPYQILQLPEGEKISNHFRLDVSNQTGATQTVEFMLVEPSSNLELVFPANPLPISAGALIKTDFFVKFTRAHLNEMPNHTLKIQARYGSTVIPLEAKLVGPES